MNIYNTAQVFKVIIEQGSMVKAAETLAVSPSVVSKKLSSLEQELGVQLLKRTTRKLELTEEGTIFYERITDIAQHWKSAVEEVTHLNRQPKGTLKICAPQPLCSRLLVPLFKKFCDQYPHIKLNLVHKMYEELPDMSADITICRKLESFNSSSVIGLPLVAYQNSLFAAPQYLGKHAKLKHCSELSQHQCINYGVTKNKHVWTFSNGDSALITPIITSDNTEIIIASTVNGLGISYIPAVIINKELHEKQLIPVLPELNSRDFEAYIYYQKLNVMPRKLRLLIEFLKDNMRG